MLMVLYRTMQMIHETARKRVGGDLGADDLFPVWVYICIHSNFVQLHSYICYMENFSSPEERITQLGYCLTTFQGFFYYFF